MCDTLVTMRGLSTGGHAPRAPDGPETPPIPLRLEHVLDEDGFVFLRYL